MHSVREVSRPGVVLVSPEDLAHFFSNEKHSHYGARPQVQVQFVKGGFKIL